MSQAILHRGTNADIRQCCAQATMQVSGDIAHRYQCCSHAMLRTSNKAGMVIFARKPDFVACKQQKHKLTAASKNKSYLIANTEDRP